MTRSTFKRGLHLPLAAAVAFCCALAVAYFWLAESKAVAATRPNVVLIQVDDMAKSLLEARYRENGRMVPAMPNVRGQLRDEGVDFMRYYVSDPICGPSRASLLTGRSVHNHGMRINVHPWGYPLWQSSQISQENLAVWLDRAGYRTIHVGKYTNGYGHDPENEVPPGWNRWVTPTRGTATYYGYPLNYQGFITPTIGSWQTRDTADCVIATLDVAGACTHATDVQTAYAVDEIGRAAAADEPFYLQLDYNAPHDDGRRPGGPTPPTRTSWIMGKTKAPQRLSEQKADRTHPVFIRKQPKLKGAVKREIQERWRSEVASLKAVDEGVGRVLDQLRATGRIDDTYILFTSDNGLFHGEHRIAYGKFLPHEPSSRLPLIVRGPGLPKGGRTAALGSNLDLAGTVLEMTGAQAGAQMDGRSLLPFARQTTLRHRSPVLLEGFNARGPDLPELFLDGSGRKRPNQALVLNYTGFVAGPWKFISYAYGEEELYNLYTDPGEKRNVVRNKRAKGIVRWARKQAKRLGACAGPACHAPVKVPRIKPPRRR